MCGRLFPTGLLFYRRRSRGSIFARRGCDGLVCAQMITQADVSRAVRGALKGVGKLAVGAVRTEISNGAIVVTVTAAQESPQAAPERAPNVTKIAERIRARHARDA